MTPNGITRTQRINNISDLSMNLLVKFMENQSTLCYLFDFEH